MPEGVADEVETMQTQNASFYKIQEVVHYWMDYTLGF